MTKNSRERADPLAMGAGRFGATYINPYRVFNERDERLDRMFANQRHIGITTAIVQWTAHIYEDGSASTTYPAGPSTGFGAFDTVLPRLLDSAARHEVDVWLGLAVRPDVFDKPDTMDSDAVFENDARVDHLLATDLLDQFEGRFVGWYLPSEPGFQSVVDQRVQAKQTAFLSTVTSGLKSIAPELPIMISPCIPRAIEGGRSGVWFIERLIPMMNGAGVDVWNLQDGFCMTAWTPAENLEMLRAGTAAAERAGATAWATLYTPGPGDDGRFDFPSLAENLDVVREAGLPLTTWTFDSALNPDPSVPDAEARAEMWHAYLEHLGATRDGVTGKA
ncbi:hypothetical protein GCM10017714_32370 [Curtobacterium pusillum]|uniref:DUF4434 domain-containing protein n=1 Tax=Curtobacterium pusillum TaxID=69373 RepID=A0ABX2MGE2_9MICO|nr:DUF4434 domain-containing protein [Curtobacterium pusillum]NUU14726.1 DUF4434 domain-containing protein [Curtobacterium pusillum]GLK31729.1 hypothetical protein GCM10017610_20140 [Curtobacterium pusillum]